eukprot:767989-Hanusia_phi.AAC.1
MSSLLVTCNSTAGGHVKAVEALIAGGCRLDKRNSGSLTPLHLAAQKSKPGVVRGLIAAGADAGLRDAQGLTAQELATDKATSAAFSRR